MGAALCCFQVPDAEDYANSDVSCNPSCLVLRCWNQLIVQTYNSIFRRGSVHPIIGPVQGASASEVALVTEDDSISETYRAPPRPLPFDYPRGSQSQHEQKSSSCFHEEPEPLTHSSDDSAARIDKNKSKLRSSKLSCSESSLKKPSKAVTSIITYIFPSSEDEDVCPTCLEEYSTENPRIALQCSHHYHLSCIYKWMERSEACPVCGKVMVFNEIHDGFENP